MKRYTTLLLASVLAAFAASRVCAESATGTITGKVSITLAEGSKNNSARYVKGAASKAGRPPNPIAVVYLEGAFPEVKRDAQTLTLGQQFLQFEQRVLPIRAGDKVLFPNRDDTFHNVFSYSPVRSFDLGRYRKGEEPGSVNFDKPGLVTVYCEIHDHMRAFILVLESPYFAASDAEGNFTLAGVPPGKHLMRIWIDPERELTREINVGAGEVITLELTE